MAKGLTAAKAKKILEDGKVRGKALTEKQKKFFGAVAGGATPLKKLNGGWLDKFDNGGVQPNYNDSNVSLPPGFKGYGYDKGGRAYNGAWDGPVTKMGGTIPGATGMMYARTSGTSPEKPKKAQDGEVMYGTPEYEAAYEEGRFADVPNQLEEVVVTAGVDYEKYPLYDKLSAQQKEYFNDPGPIGRGVRRAAQTDRGLAEDTYDVVNPIMYGALGVAGGMAFAPQIATLGRAAVAPIGRALNYKPLGGPVSIGNVVDAGSAAYAAYATPEAYRQYQENPNFDTGLDLALTSVDLVPFSEIFTGGKNIRKLYNKGKNLFTNDLKPNPNMYYRGIGQSGLDDITESGLLRAKPSDQIAPAMFGPFDLAKRFNQLYVTPRLGVAQRYGKGVVAEVPRDVASFSRRYKGSDWSMMTNNQIPIEEVNLYKKNFFGNYKALNIPQPPLSSMPFTKPNIYPTSSPLPKSMEPYLSKRVYPFNKEQEIFESFLPIEAQLKNIDSKSLYYNQAGKRITKGEADNLLYPPEYQKNGGEVDKAQFGKILKAAKNLYKGFKSSSNVVEPILGSGITARRLSGDQLYNTHRYSAQQLNQLLEESRAFLKNTPTEGYENSAKFKDEVLRKIEKLEAGVKKDLALQEIAKRSGRTVGDDTGTWMAKSYIDAPSSDQLGHVTTSNNLWDMVFKSDGKMIPYSNSETLYFNRGGEGQLARVRMMAPENQGGGINLIFDNNSLKKSGIFPDSSGGELTISQDVSLKHLYPEAKIKAKDMLLNEAEFRGVEITDDLLNSIDNALQIKKNKNGSNIPKAQVGDKVASIASQMEVNEEDGGRPPLGVVDHIRALFDEEGLCRDNTCVQTVKDFYSKAGVEAIPKDVYNNREFLKNFKEYGFEEILDQKNLQPGDVIQYYYGPDSEDVKEDPSYLNFPYHMGVYVSPGEYIGDGDSKAPIQRKNMYTGTKDGKEYKKDPFRAFRYIKQNKNGSDVEKAQWGKLLKLAKKYGSKAVDYVKGLRSEGKKVANTANTTGKLKYLDELSYDAKKDIRELNYKVQSKTDKETRKLGKPHAAQEEYGEGWKYSDEVDFNNPEEVAAHRKRWIDSQKKGNFLYQNRSFPLFDETSDIFSDLSRYDLNSFMGNSIDRPFVEKLGNRFTSGLGEGTSYTIGGTLNPRPQDFLTRDVSISHSEFDFDKAWKYDGPLKEKMDGEISRFFNNLYEPKTSKIDFGDLLKNKNRNGGWLSKYENGGVIEDDRGQWAYPGEVTKINSNNITMKGVNYPVLGISDTGDTKMMQPGKDYKFKGNSVTEFPMAKDGKSLVELNQLTNFTNYNTPQPGGWLDKYH
jgi:hypothetical protein